MDIVYYLVLLLATLLISFFMAVREIKYNQNIPLSLSLSERHELEIRVELN